MKIQDILFIIILLLLLWKRKPEWLVGVAIFSVIIAVPLFAKWIFFTAERLTYYGFGFLLCAVVILFIQEARRK